MSREKQGFEENLIRIREMFPGVEVLNKRQAAAFCNVDRHTIVKLIRFNTFGMITPQDFARQISV